MVSAGEEDGDEETQAIETDSPPLGAMPSKDGLEEDVNHGTVPLEDTLSLQEDGIMFETELVCNWDDTQLLEEREHIAADQNPAEGDNWAKTQIMEECEEIDVTKDDEDEGTERTFTLSDDGGPSDDGASPCGVEYYDGGGENEPGPKRGKKGTGGVLPPSPHCWNDRSKKEFVVDSDASTDEESSAGPVRRRSFTEVRAASLRASGLAAARNMTPKTTDTEANPFLWSSQTRKKQGNVIKSQADAKVIGKDVGITITGEPLLDTRVGELNLDCEIENSHMCMQDRYWEETKSRIGNTTARKLIYEENCPGKEESTDKIISTGKSNLPHSLLCDYSVAGLSYLDSQEPGELSQANALDVVDKILSINDVGLSQEVDPGQTCRVKSPPVSSAKGAQCLVKRGGHKSPVGKAGIFDWVDSLEDEGGGDFFCKIKGSFFERSDNLKKSHNQPSKPKLHSSGLARDGVGKGGRKKGVNPKINLRSKDLTFSKSRLKLENSTRSDKLQISEVKTNRTFFKDMGEQLNSESTLQQLEAADFGRGDKGIYDVGPDTQIAVEAMEALVCGPPADHELGHAHQGPDRSVTKKKASSKHVSLQKKASSASDSEGITRRSKRIKMLYSNLSTENPNSSKKHLKNSSAKKYLEENCKVKENLKSEKGKPEEQLRAWNSVDEHLSDGKSFESFRREKVGRKKGGKSSTSFKRDKREKKVVGSCIMEVDRCPSLSTSNDQLLFSNELTQSEHTVNITPVAHRTRQSKLVKTLDRAEALSNHCERATKHLMQVNDVRVKRRQIKFVADAPGQLSDQGKGSNKVEELENNISNKLEVREIEACETSSMLKDALSHPKRRRTRQNVSGNSNNAVNLNHLSLLRGVVPEANAPCPMQQNGSKVVGSAPMIPDTVKSKSRGVAACLPSEIGEFFSNIRGVSIASGVRTRSSVNLHPSISSNEKDSIQSLKAKILFEAGSSNATYFTPVMNKKVPPKELAPPTSISLACSTRKHDVDLTSHVVDAEGNANLEGSPKEKAQPSGSTCTTPLNKINTVSPVCTSVDPLKMSYKKGLSRSAIARELIRLESAEASPRSKDLRRRRDIASIRVFFSNHLDDDIIKQQKKILARLGVSIASTILDATHFITDKFVRTRNMLEAMAVGKPVVTHMWLESCGQASCFIDEKNYILRDPKKEKEIGFSMPVSLARASQNPLLQGRRVFITPNVKPDRELIASLVKAAQGQPMERFGRSAIKDDKVPDDLLVVSCEEDFKICIPLLEKGAEVFSSELLLNGIVVQKLEYERHRLFLNHVRRTRSTIWLRENGDQFLPVTKCT